MASRLPHPVIRKLKAWRGARGFSQSQALRALVQAGIPVALTTLQQWEIARSFPRPLMAAALERFLVAQEKVPPLPVERSIAPVIERLKACRGGKDFSGATQADELFAAAVPWEQTAVP